MTLESPRYAPNSETSRQAANTVDYKKQAGMALNFIKSKGEEGATIDELSVHLTAALNRMIPPGTASARMKQLVDAKMVSKTPLKRMTRSGSPAGVYIAGSWADKLPEFIPPAPEEVIKSAFERWLEGQQKNGHGHVVKRLDGSRPQRCGGTISCKECIAGQKYYDYHMKEKP